MVGCLAWVHQYLDPTDVPEGKTFWDVVVSEPLICVIAAGPAPLTTVDPWAVSRSHPHYFFQGAFVSEHGEIGWVGVRMADGMEIGIVNGRVLDLSQGNLILVRQHEDGSIRVFQHRTRIEPARDKELRATLDRMLAEESLRRFLGG